MSRLVLGIADGLAIFCAEFGILDRDGLIDRGVTGYVRCIVRKGAQGEGVLVDILAPQQQLENKISTADVVHQIAKFPAAKRVVAEILDDRASVGIGMGLGDLLLRQSRISLEEQWADLV